MGSLWEQAVGGPKKLAVREGFEPSVGFKAYGALAKLCFRPLSHLT